MIGCSAAFATSTIFVCPEEDFIIKANPMACNAVVSVPSQNKQDLCRTVVTR